MPRAPRIIVAGGLYHVLARGNRRVAIFLDDRDHERFLSLVDKECTRRGWLCRAYCLMPNHFHLLLEMAKPNLSEGMQALLGVYARWFNWRRDLEGHLFGRRFRCVSIETEPHFLEVARYVALNPVRAELCERAEDWRWSSYAPTLGLAPRPRLLEPGRLLAGFAPDLRSARRGLAAFVADGYDH
jgi:putative transposase